MTLAEIKKAVAAIMSKAEADFTVDSQDLFLFAVNQVRRDAELIHDFEFSRKLVNLDVDGVLGGSLDDATYSASAIDSVTVTGTLNPDVTGTFKRIGTFNGYPLFLEMAPSAATASFLHYRTSASQWWLSAALDLGDDEGNFFSLATTNQSPAGTYSTNGSATGTAVVAVTNTFTIKSIIDIGIYDEDGNLRPSEWTTVSEGLERQRGENPYSSYRYPTDAQALTEPCGIRRFEVSNNQIYSWPKSTTDDFAIGIECYTFQNDWTTTTNIDDIWTKHAHKYLVWGTVVFLNYRFKTFVYRQEGNLQSPEKLRDEGLEAFREWDSDRYETNRRHGR